MTLSLNALTLPKTRRRLSGYLGPREATVVAGATILLLKVVFLLMRSEADNTGVPQQRRDVVAADRILGLGQTPTERLQGWLFQGHAGIIDWTAFAAYVSWFVLPGVVTAWVLLRRRDLIVSYGLSRYGIDLVCAIIFFLMPTEPPWMALNVTQILGVMHRAREVDPNPVAAFPSLHVAIPVVQAFWLRRHGMFKASAFYGALGALIAVAVVYTGQHYVVDCLTGVALAYAVDRAAARVEGPVSGWLGARHPAFRAIGRAAATGEAALSF